MVIFQRRKRIAKLIVSSCIFFNTQVALWLLQNYKLKCGFLVVASVSDPSLISKWARPLMKLR
jgi:hypothetical protein